ncbi:olfactory receptor 6B1-like [Protobothrops mucrosquamatus]|uniref:olfactory receptor 6B1-like n=1 Tax=Protobothrops mucrosquamatus TaxID=103944 RepID=UPI0010FB7BBF|nr:olfactory receptor 6B1-like [Protobothrops mucrosquamatus]
MLQKNQLWQQNQQIISRKEKQNQTVIKEFILLGFRNLQNIRIILLLVFLIIYIMTIAGNVLIVLLVATDRHLHTPMYFFLGNLSCLESFYSSAILPRMLASFFNGDRSISINGCFVQHYFFAYLAAVECYLLSAMSYDRYVAICKPLHYVSVMNGKLCLHMAAGSWVTGFIASTITIILMSRLVFCGPNEIDHFFCDTYPIMQLSCSNTLLLRILILTFVSLFTLPPFTLTLLSYTYIISTILKIPSTIGKQKAFSTCSSHLIVVTIYYGSITVAYTLPDLNSLSDWNKLISAFYTILTPLINPLIYSLRNKEVKNSLQRSIVIAWVRNQGVGGSIEKFCQSFMNYTDIN